MFFILFLFVIWQQNPFLININYVTCDRNRENWKGANFGKAEMIILFWYDQFELVLQHASTYCRRQYNIVDIIEPGCLSLNQ